MAAEESPNWGSVSRSASHARGGSRTSPCPGSRSRSRCSSGSPSPRHRPVARARPRALPARGAARVVREGHQRSAERSPRQARAREMRNQQQLVLRPAAQAPPAAAAPAVPARRARSPSADAWPDAVVNRLPMARKYLKKDAYLRQLGVPDSIRTKLMQGTAACKSWALECEAKCGSKLYAGRLLQQPQRHHHCPCGAAWSRLISTKEEAPAAAKAGASAGPRVGSRGTVPPWRARRSVTPTPTRTAPLSSPTSSRPKSNGQSSLSHLPPPPPPPLIAPGLWAGVLVEDEPAGAVRNEAERTARAEVARSLAAWLTR
mmetsp:Transcript_101822/g.311398  ORF Transcript_101822/g.311398 Transcript_101822/m.311398 type:complete len:317 (-) Transcript_101822:554-1504(-)